MRPPKILTHYTENADIIWYHGDTLDFLATVPDNSVQLVVSSPPYNIGKEYESVQQSLETYIEGQQIVLEELYRVLKPEGSLCWQVGTYVKQREVFPLDIYYYQILKSVGFQLRNRVIWKFGHGLHAKHRFSGRYETLLWWTKTGDYKFNLDPLRIPQKEPTKRAYQGEKIGKLTSHPLGKNPSDVWQIITRDWEECVWDIPNVKSNHPEKTIHPCQFPIELAERCVLAFTDEGDRVLDPYAGVGSTIIAALLHERQAMGAEKEHKYSAIAKRRIDDLHRGVLAIRPIERPIFNPEIVADKGIPPPKQARKI